MFYFLPNLLTLVLLAAFGDHYAEAVRVKGGFTGYLAALLAVPFIDLFFVGSSGRGSAVSLTITLLMVIVTGVSDAVAQVRTCTRYIYTFILEAPPSHITTYKEYNSAYICTCTYTGFPLWFRGQGRGRRLHPVPPSRHSGQRYPHLPPTHLHKGFHALLIRRSTWIHCTVLCRSRYVQLCAALSFTHACPSKLLSLSKSQQIPTLSQVQTALHV